MTGAAPHDALEVPARLRRRLDELRGEHGLHASSDGRDTLRAVVGVVGTVLAQPDASRETAIDLLAVDALVTGAIESLAGEPEHFGARCEEAIQVLAAIPARP